MTKQVLIALSVVATAAACVTMLGVALITGSKDWLLAESALLHGAIIFIVLTARKGN